MHLSQLLQFLDRNENLAGNYSAGPISPYTDQPGSFGPKQQLEWSTLSPSCLSNYKARNVALSPYWRAHDSRITTLHETFTSIQSKPLLCPSRRTSHKVQKTFFQHQRIACQESNHANDVIQSLMVSVNHRGSAIWSLLVTFETCKLYPASTLRVDKFGIRAHFEALQTSILLLQRKTSWKYCLVYKSPCC